MASLVPNALSNASLLSNVPPSPSAQNAQLVRPTILPCKAGPSRTNFLPAFCNPALPGTHGTLVCYVVFVLICSSKPLMSSPLASIGNLSSLSWLPPPSLKTSNALRKRPSTPSMPGTTLSYEHAARMTSSSKACRLHLTSCP
jgi:hypothetical protein